MPAPSGDSPNWLGGICGGVGGSLPYNGMANTAVFTQRLEVRLRQDQRERLDLTAELLDCDVAALVRLAIDNMFYDMDEMRRRDSTWRGAIQQAAKS